jgi:hypothetical protein
MSELSPRTTIRDAIVSACRHGQGTTARRVQEYAVALNYLTDSELKQSAVYCVLVTDETGADGSSFQRDMVAATVKVVLWANDANDPREKLDRMIEDACDSVRVALQALRSSSAIVSGVLEEITTDEATTAAGPLAQAVIRLSVMCQRPAVMT